MDKAQWLIFRVWGLATTTIGLGRTEKRLKALTEYAKGVKKYAPPFPDEQATIKKE